MAGAFQAAGCLAEGVGMSVKFPDELTAPEGGWGDLIAQGVEAQACIPGACTDFAKGAMKAIRMRGRLGVMLERESESDNEAEGSAIKVIGYWRWRGLLSSANERRHIGYVPRKLAQRLVREAHAVGRQESWGAHLRHIGMENRPRIVFDVLGAA
jgi:hypothetical protein